MAKNPDDIVAVLYGSETTYGHCAAWCKFHHCHLTPKQIIRKVCLGKQCKCLDKILSHPYWEQREKKKELKKGGNKE